MAGLYLDKLDVVMQQMKKDFYALKKDMISKHRMDIKCIDQCTYIVNGKIIEYKPKELRLMTAELMRDYLYGNKATEFKSKHRVWKEE
ncbi:hypothetical protein CV093_10260 [Oceanobacillus sp. 143]|nr:hypothetical protein CV093_10260 [Oceanobacillus sp. 143]